MYHDCAMYNTPMQPVYYSTSYSNPSYLSLVSLAAPGRIQDSIMYTTDLRVYTKPDSSRKVRCKLSPIIIVKFDDV